MEPEERAALAKPSATSRRAKSATVVYEPLVPEAAAIDGVKLVSKKMRRTKIWEGHPKARAKAEAAEKELWVGQVVAFLRKMGVDALVEVAQQVDPEASLRRVCSHLRGPTLRGHVQVWKSYWSWWMACGGTFDAHQADGCHQVPGDKGCGCLHGISDQEDSGSTQVSSR